MSKVVTRKMYDKVRESHRKGMRVTDICKKFNLDSETVRSILFENI